MDKILDKARPTFEDEKPVNVFDFWEGADFKLRMKKVEGYPNYDASVFAEPSQIAEADHDILKIAKSQHLLKDFLDPKNFKSYAELKAKLTLVLGEGSASTAADDDIPFENAKPIAAKTAKAAPAKAAAVDSDSGLDEDSAAYFRSLAQDD